MFSPVPGPECRLFWSTNQPITYVVFLPLHSTSLLLCHHHHNEVFVKCSNRHLSSGATNSPRYIRFLTIGHSHCASANA